MRGDARSVAWVTLLTAGLIAAGFPAGAVVAGGGPPLADAGLDQTVTRGATVYLDGRGSRAPDGEITGYRWRITTPDGGTTTTLTDPTAPRTEFVARQVGTYEVTLEVTDDEGRRATDSLYVKVEPPTPPSVTLDGPETVTTVGTESYTARVDPGDNPVETIVWFVDGTEVAREPLAGTRTTQTIDPPAAGTAKIAATVIDTAGERDTARLEVTVAGLPPDPGSERTPNQAPGANRQADRPRSTPTDVTPTTPDSPGDPIRPIEGPELGEPGSEAEGGFVEPKIGMPREESNQMRGPSFTPWAFTSTGAISEGLSIVLDETGLINKRDNNEPNSIAKVIETGLDAVLGNNKNNGTNSKITRAPGPGQETRSGISSNKQGEGSSRGAPRSGAAPISVN